MIDKNQVQSRYVDEWNCNIIIVSNLSGTGRFPWENLSMALRHYVTSVNKISFLGY